MKVMALNQYGDPEVLQPLDLPTPKPQGGEVRIKTRALSINPVNYKWRKNGPFKDFPVVLGWDVSGVVDGLGSNVSEFSVGNEVFGMVRFPQEGRAYAEYVTAPVTDVALKPQSLSHPDAAAMTLAALTAHQAFEKMNLRAGQRVLIHAAAGGVGHFAVQLAKARGATVIGTASSKNWDFVLGPGADEFVDYYQQPFEDQVAGVDAVLSTVSGDTLPRSFEVLKWGGWLVNIAGKPSGELAQARGVHAEHILVYPSKADLEMLSALYEAGQLKPYVSQTFPLERVADAHRAQESGRTVGKIVLEVG